MVTHGHTASSGAAFFFGNPEAEIVGIAHVCRDTHLENSNAFLAAVDFVVVVGVLDLFQSLFLVELEFPGDGAI